TTDLGGDAAASGDELERAVRGRDQSARETDSLGFVAVEEMLRRTIAEHAGELPREVGRVSDPGVHPLPADGTVDVRGIAEQEAAALPKPRRDAMMHLVRGEPVHAADVDAQPLQQAGAHVVPAEILAFLLGPGTNGADQADVA